MSWTSPLLVLTFIWAAIYALYHVLKPSRAQSLLPSAVNTRYSRRNVWNESATQVVLSGLHLRVQTTAWNLSHDLLATSLRGPRVRVGKALTRFYDLGSIMGLAGMLGALAFLAMTGGMSAASLTRKLWAANVGLTSPDLIDGLIKRGLGNFNQRESLPDEPWIKPIIPGLTVPLAHLPVILVAVFLAQLVHELGHAIAAAIEALPVLSAGISFTLVIPSAFVTFPSAAVDDLAPRARARIVAGGPFHNIVLWCMLLFIGYTGLGSLLWSIGYQDISALGRVVIGVDILSPLHGFLPSGSVISALDDTPLGSPNASYDTWTSYLRQKNKTPTLGWCAGPFDWDYSCCSANKTRGLSCFVSTDSPSNKGCLDPIPVLTSFSRTERCISTANCAATSICVTPDESEHLLRLMIHQLPGDGSPKVILWSGPRQEIWEEVRVGTLLPRTSILPVSLPLLAEVFWEYLLMATLSLYFFNLLPLPYLDGLQFLKIILQLVLNDTGDEARDEYELEAFEIPQERRRPRRQMWWKGMLGHVIPRLTIALFAGCALLGMIDVYW